MTESVEPTVERPNLPMLEVCVGSVDDAVVAAGAGADRLELCGALELGGLTPSIGLVRAVLRAVDLPVVVMIRPRSAGFAYNEREIRCMLIDVEAALDAGASGVVFGALDSKSEIDRAVTQRVVSLAGSHETVFHRAFDSAPRPEQALEALVDSGVTRVLTSDGGAGSDHRVRGLRRMVDLAAGRIEILAGGGVRPGDVASLVADSGCCGVHVGASTGLLDPSTAPAAAAAFCDHSRLAAGEYRAVSGEKVAGFRGELDALC